MMTVHEISRLSGVSIRTLQYYDKIGLLMPAGTTEAGYRLYDENSLEKLQQILFFRELEFSLKEIGKIVNSSGFDREKALSQQIELLTLKKERLEALIELAETVRQKGEKRMNFDAFDTKKMTEYADRAKAAWGQTAAYQEYKSRSEGQDLAEKTSLADRMMQIFTEFGKILDQDSASAPAQELVGKLQQFITAHYYTCTEETLSELGRLYAAGGEFTENIDRAGGPGTAAFAAAAIRHYCRKT